MDGSQDIARGLVVARGDGAEPFDSCEENLNQVTRSLRMPIERARLGKVGLFWDHRSLAVGAKGSSTR